MPVTLYRLGPSPFSTGLSILLQPEGEPETYRNLAAMLTDLSIGAGDLIKVGDRCQYPILYGRDIGPPESTAVFNILGQYVAIVFEGRSVKWAKHCWLFDSGEVPFLPSNVNNPPAPREKHDHEMTAKEWLFWKWGRTKRPPQEPKVLV